jgi:hypothetical protein
MGGDSLTRTHMCPACGRLMNLTRIIAAGPGYAELRTCGCAECGVWVTEGSPQEISLSNTFGMRKRGFPGN